MAYDFVVDIGNPIRPDPIVIGSIDHGEFLEISALLSRKDSFFLNRISDLFQDQSFSVEELIQAQSHLLALLPIELGIKERILLHELIAVVTYALSVQRSLSGVSD